MVSPQVLRSSNCHRTRASFVVALASMLKIMIMVVALAPVQAVRKLHLFSYFGDEVGLQLEMLYHQGPRPRIEKAIFEKGGNRSLLSETAELRTAVDDLNVRSALSLPLRRSR